MHRTFDEWLSFLVAICKETNYDAVLNGGNGGSAGIAIVPKGAAGPQRICVYPRKSKGAALVVEEDVFDLIQTIPELSQPNRVKSNRPHYTDVKDEVIDQAITLFMNGMNTSLYERNQQGVIDSMISRLLQFPSGYETCTAELFKELYPNVYSSSDFDRSILFDVHINLVTEAEKRGLKLDSSQYDGLECGLPFYLNFSVVKKPISSDRI